MTSSAVSHDASPLRAVLVITFLVSLSTGVFWSGLSFIAKATYGFGEARNLVLFAFMGALYTVGAFIVGSQRPNPNPHVFGYHEIWHVFVIVANVVHYVLFWLIVTGQSPISA